MGYYRFMQTARQMITGVVMLAILVTSFAPGWLGSASAAAAPGAPASPSTEMAPAALPGGSALSAPARPTTVELAPLNTLVFSEPGRAEALQEAIVEAGGYVYVRQGDALFVGLNDGIPSDLVLLGARAAYQGTLSDNQMAALDAGERAAAAIWNEMLAGGVQAVQADLHAGGVESSLYIHPDSLPAAGPRRVNEPQTSDTSTFMVGSISVNVVFVESTGTGTTENWTTDEVNKTKAEVMSALDWWVLAATAPEVLGGTPRPPAQITWDVTFYSPFEGTADEKTYVKLANQEPITGGIQTGFPRANDPGSGGGWMAEVALKFVNDDPGQPDVQLGQALRTWADRTRTANQTDWAFVLFVVDSSADADGKFNADSKAGGGAINGPWAVVTYDGGALGISNLEVLIAKMVGHVFGAGDESYDETTGKGCDPEEYYGYLRIRHENCEKELGEAAAVSLMRDDDAMVYAYQQYALSNAARQQVGWRDSDDDGIYDVMDTLRADLPAGLPASPVCPVLHLTGGVIVNEPAVPSDFGPGGSENGWAGYIWNGTQYVSTPSYHKVNINEPGYVWGRLDGGEWVAGTITVDPNTSDKLYNLPDPAGTKLLYAEPGTSPKVEIALMNRWQEETFRIDPTSIPIQPAPTSGLHDGFPDPTSKVEFFDPYGMPGGWFESAHSGSWDGYVMFSGTSASGSEACFSFEGTEVTIYYADLSTGSANVLVDGKLHSTITYTQSGTAKLEHLIANLAPGKHVVQIISQSGVIVFDAFEITNKAAGTVINGLTDPDTAGIYEHTGAKLFYVGEWSQVNLTGATTRPGTPDGRGRRSVRPNDRIYATFNNADTVAIYRSVFPNGGSADVYLNGEYWGTMNNHSKTARVAPFYISGLSPAITYTLEIRVNSNTPRFDLDALRFLNLATTTDPALMPYKVPVPGEGQPLPPPVEVPYNGDQERYGNWLNKGTFLQARDDGDLLNVFFQGSAIAVQRRTDPTYGMLELYVDGKLIRTVNNATATSTDTPIILHGFDANFPHVLQVRVINQSPSTPKWNSIYGYTVFYVKPLTPGLAAEEYEEYVYDANGVPVRSNFIYEEAWTAPIKYTKEPGPSDDFYIKSKHPNARAYLYFTDADTITLYGVVGDLGQADLYVNGTFKGSFNQANATLAFNKPFTISGLNRDMVNVLEIRVGAAAGLPKVIAFDRVVLYNRPILGPGEYENNGEVDLGGGVYAPALQFSGQWARVENSLAHGGSSELVGSKNDTLSFEVRNATSIIVYRRLSSTFGKADVYVDGDYYTSFDNYAANNIYQQPYVISGLDAGFNHSVVIKPRQTGFKPFDIDYIEVRDTESSLTTYLVKRKAQDDDANLISGKGLVYSGNWDLEGGAHKSSAKGARAMLVFYGNAFTTYFNYKADGGTADVYVDGVLYGTAKTTATKLITGVPFSVAGLDEKMHTAEIIVRSGVIRIDAYEAFTEEGEDTVYDLASYDTVKKECALSPFVTLIRTGNWTLKKVTGESDCYLQTNEAGASLYIYAKGGDTFFVRRQALTTTNNIELYVNGELATIAEKASLKGLTADEEFPLSGLSGMKTTPYWLQVRNPAAGLLSLRMLRVGELTPKHGAGDGTCNVEAENESQIHSAGVWKKKPDVNNPNYSGGRYLLAGSKNSRLYVAIQNTPYVSIYRPTGPDYGDAAVYVDGVYWGKMSNYSAVVRYSVPFSIGPIPGVSNAHVVELRPTNALALFGVDRVTCTGMKTLFAGYYENDSRDPADDTPYFLYTGAWKVITNAEASGGTLHQSKGKGDRISAIFDGNMIRIYRQLGLDGKYMSVLVDGVEYPVNNYATKNIYRDPFTILLPTTGLHTFEVILTSGTVLFDAVEVGTAIPATFGAYQESHPMVVVNRVPTSWTVQESAAHSEGAYLWTKQKYSSTFFMFSGQRVTAYMTRGLTWGKVRFFLDGKALDEVDLYLKTGSGQDEPFYAYDLTNLPKGTHVLEMRFEGRKGLGTAKANVDAFTVDGAPVPRGEPIPPSDPDTGGGGELPPDMPTFGCYEESTLAWVRSPNEGERQWEQRQSQWGPPQYPEIPDGPSMWTYVVSPPPSTDEIYAEFDFSARGFRFIYRTGANGGLAEVWVDGVLKQTLNMNGPEAWRVEYTYIFPAGDHQPNQIHVVRIKPAPNETREIYVDRIDIVREEDGTLIYPDCPVIPQ